MKKIISLSLAILMIATMLAINVSAERVVGGSDGVATFDPTTTGDHDINVKVSNVTHKYAVDLDFSFADLTLGGTIEWNVDTMKYDITGATATDTTRTIKVSNRSDLPVYAYATVTDTDAGDSITVSTTNNNAANKLTIAKATAGGASNGTATDGTITINITSTNWGAVAAYYSNKRLEDSSDGEKTYAIANVTVTISKN